MIEAVIILDDEQYNMPLNFPLATPLQRIANIVGQKRMNGRCTVVAVEITKVIT